MEVTRHSQDPLVGIFPLKRVELVREGSIQRYKYHKVPQRVTGSIPQQSPGDNIHLFSWPCGYAGAGVFIPLHPSVVGQKTRFSMCAVKAAWGPSFNDRALVVSWEPVAVKMAKNPRNVERTPRHLLYPQRISPRDRRYFQDANFC